jgi:hypothetical protein
VSEQLQVEVVEALCSALYQMPFSTFLGENDPNGERTAWFVLGEKPKNVRVSVIRPENPATVLVRIEWHNLTGDTILRGSQTLTISTYMADRAQAQGPVQDAVLRVLAVYKDVLEGTGVAGPIADLQKPEPEPEPEEDEDYDSGGWDWDAMLDEGEDVAPQDTEGGAPQ